MPIRRFKGRKLPLKNNIKNSYKLKVVPSPNENTLGIFALQLSIIRTWSDLEIRSNFREINEKLFLRVFFKASFHPLHRRKGKKKYFQIFLDVQHIKI